MTAPATISRRAWLVWGVALASYVTAVLGRSSLAATGAEAAQRFGVSSSVLSLLAVVQIGVYAALQIPAGVLVDRVGPRRLIVTGAVLVAVGQAVLALSSVFAVAVLGRVLVGAGDAVAFVSVLRLVPAWFPARRVPVVNQFTGILGQLGQVISAVPLAGLVATAGWTPAYLAAAGAAALCAALAVLVLRDGATPTATAPPTGGGVVEVLRAGSTRLGFWCHFVSPFSANVFGLLWGFPFLTVGEGVAPVTAGGLLSLVVLTGVVCGPLLGLLAGRFPRRRLTQVGVAVGLQAVTWSAVLAWPGPAPLALLVVLAVVLGLGGPASLVAFDLARAGVRPDQVGRATGVTNVGGWVATLLVVLLVGLVLDLQGAGRPEQWSPEVLRVAMLVQFPLWAVGLAGIWWLRRGPRG